MTRLQGGADARERRCEAARGRGSPERPSGERGGRAERPEPGQRRRSERAPGSGADGRTGGRTDGQADARAGGFGLLGILAGQGNGGAAR